ncbi:hypothetical protein DCAR_0417386 [Daucus carota subsp. sativus]|uniref:Uncharacterized protein n=1 Tax=Daucus carota subsp. sativus TaxID=79200 RepID=A0AAF0WXR3_DAUCS|nr:hypothetical protein DCAR_0417386 [Daucus carota subsp. sativus]
MEFQLEYEDELMEPELDMRNFFSTEGAEVDVDADANREDDLADPLLADGEEKQEEKPAERPRKTLKNMTRYERARILGTRALQIRKVLILLKYFMNAPVIVELEGETDPIEELIFSLGYDYYGDMWMCMCDVWLFNV